MLHRLSFRKQYNSKKAGMELKKVLLCAVFLTMGICYGASPMADSFSAYRGWLFIAYVYCTIFGLLIFTAFEIVINCSSLKNAVKPRILQLTEYLRHHNVLAIIFYGILLALPFGIILDGIFQALWFIGIIPSLVLLFLFPILLSITYLRNRCLLSPKMTELLAVLLISAILASIAFIILTNAQLLPYIDDSYMFRTGNRVHYFGSQTHPYDSLMHIWEQTVYGLAATVVSIPLYGLGRLLRYLIQQLTKKKTPGQIE